MKTKKVRICIGLPGSGKTTETEDFLRKNPDWVKIGRDEFRFMLRNAPVLGFREENMITSMVFDAARKALRSGFNVILDNTHCKVEYIEQAIEELGEMADIEYRLFDVPVETCIERDSRRDRVVGEKVIRKMAKDLKNLKDSFHFQPQKARERKRKDYSKDWNPDLPNAVIFDIDGTLAHFGNKRGPFDWKRVGVDDVDRVVARQLQMHRKNGDTILIVSGRDGSCRQETSDWLEFYDLEFDQLFMRPVNDFRKDNIIKKEIYHNEILGKYNVIVIYDDRDQVVKMWREELGLKVFQVEPGDF